MIPAYDDPILWEGHASLAHEIKQQLPEGVKPDAIFCSVGGAGLAGGIMDGCKAVGWDDGKLTVVWCAYFPTDSRHPQCHWSPLRPTARTVSTNRCL